MSPTKPRHLRQLADSKIAELSKKKLLSRIGLAQIKHFLKGVMTGFVQFTDQKKNS